MLEWLKLENVGPAPKFELDFAPRVNLITGDNGLGKSFLLDVAWWTLTGVWADGVIAPNSSAITGQSSIEWQTFYEVLPHHHYESSTSRNEAKFDFVLQEWGFNKLAIRFPLTSLVIQSKIDGKFSVYDPYKVRLNSPNLAFVFDSAAVWDGLEQENTLICNGLIRDWAMWQLENGDSFKQLRAALKVLSPDEHETLEPGKLTRVSLDDARDIPTLKMPYGQEVPIVHASAGIRRVVSLAYLMVWAWQEHLRAAKLTRREPTREMVILIDELEEHLHPRWQRVILPALLEVAKTIMAGSDVRVQIIAATHSPMVMASLEPLFDAQQDAWFDLNLVDGTVTLEKMPWRRRGDANAWLKSEAFDLPSTYSREAGQAIEKASSVARASRVSKKRFLEVDEELRRYLSDTDPFWIRWRSLGENKGWL
jgi:AAA domain, putative AbiEii toxin, Type IV TA system